MIDVIIPAYNCHDTIRNTLMSIAMQSISDDIKVYIVDDCSEEKYDYLIDEFKKYLDIKIIRQRKNKGPGAARQKGIESSNGEYIMFIDGDDTFIHAYSLENLRKHIGGYDIAIGVMKMEIDKDVYEIHKDHEHCLHGKMYRREFIEKNDIHFINNYRHEDRFFHNLCLLYNPLIIYTNDYVYNYIFVEKSLTHNSVMDNINACNTLCDVMKELTNITKEKKLNSIAMALFNEGFLLMMYNVYNEFYEYYKEHEIFSKMYESAVFYDEYKHFLDLNETTKYFLENVHRCGRIPVITWDQFLDKILEIKK